MNFARLDPYDYAAIVRAERARRQQAAAKAGWPADRRTADDADWAAIEDFDFHLVEIRAPEDRVATPERAAAERLAAIAHTVAATALRRHRAENLPRASEAEARAYKLLNLSRRLDRCTGTPSPTLADMLAVPAREAA